MEGKYNDNNEKEKENKFSIDISINKHPIVTGNICCLWVIKSPVGNFPLSVSCTSFFVSLLITVFF